LLLSLLLSDTNTINLVAAAAAAAADTIEFSAVDRSICCCCRSIYLVLWSLLLLMSINLSLAVD
jgi:hypothetical protein